MKTTFNRLIYDTATATLVAEDREYGNCYEQLYVTAKGNWFVHDWGGVQPRYADVEGDLHSEGESIVPVTRYEALAWCEKHMAQHAIDGHFTDLVDEA